jgi:hypothetical protein
MHTMTEPSFVAPLIARYPNALHFVLGTPDPLGEWVFVQLEDRGKLITFLGTEVSAQHHEEIPPSHRDAIAAEVAKPRRDDELLLFVVRGDELEAARIDRARIERELPPPFLVDARNHFPVPWPARWDGPYALDNPDTYRFTTPDCQVLARIDEHWDYGDLDDEGQPGHEWRIEIGVTRAMDPAHASDDQVAQITARFRDCGPWVEATYLHARRHPSRRIFHAEVGGLPKGTPWPEVQPMPEVMLGPPPGWEPLASFSARPLVFRIEGTSLHVEWIAPPGSSFFEAATGRLSEPSRYTISAPERKPTDEEVGTVFAMLGGAAFTEEKLTRSKAKAGANARVFLATAGWLRKTAGRA